MPGGGGEGVLPVLRAPDNAADAVYCEQIPLDFYALVPIICKYTYWYKKSPLFRGCPKMNWMIARSDLCQAELN